MKKTAGGWKQSPALGSLEKAADDSATELSHSERKVARERTAPRAAVIREAIRVEGKGELRRPISAPIWSGRLQVFQSVFLSSQGDC
jgi:hypothetical protein